MRNLVILLAFILSYAFSSTTAVDFLNAPASIEGASRGGVAVDASTTGFLKNPAMLVRQKASLYITQGTLLEETKYMSLTYAQPQLFDQLACGGSLIHTGIDGIQETSYDGTTGTADYTGKTFGYSAQAYVFGAALPLAGTTFSIGTNLKFIREQLFTESAAGFGCDLGIQASLNKNIDLGITVINLVQPHIRWSTGATYAVDKKLIASSAYHFNEALTFIADIEKNEATPATLRFGAEYTLFSFITLRGSYGTALALGTGLTYGDLRIDYAYLDTEKNLGKTQYVGLAYSFATPQNNNAPEKTVIETVPTPAVVVVPPPVTMNAVVGETAEIKPLPLPEPQAPVVELITPNASVTPTMLVEPIPEPTEEKTVTVSLPDIPQTPVYEYQIAVVSPRYYSSGKLQIKVFVDNTGNQTETITANLKILTMDGTPLMRWQDEAKKLTPRETGVYYFDLTAPLYPGTYYLEVQTKSSSVTRYEKEAFIVR